MGVFGFASVIPGGPAPLIASYAIAIYIAICAVTTLATTAMMTDYAGKGISGEYQSQ
jgi:hypothetical protein